MNRIRIILLLVLLMMVSAAFSEEIRVPSSSKTDKDIASAPRPESVAQKESAYPTKMLTILEPGLQAIENDYGVRMNSLRAQIAAAQTEEERDALQSQGVALKTAWSLALANRQLELARERHDADSEAEILRAIENIQQVAARGVR